MIGSLVERKVGRADVAAGPVAWMFGAERWQAPENASGGAVFAGRANEVQPDVAAADRSRFGQ